MKKLLCAAICLIILIAICVPSFAQAGTQITVIPDKATVHPGDEITFTVHVSGDKSFTSLGFVPYYNTDVYELIGTEVLTENHAMADFSMTDGGVVMFSSASAHSGNFFRFTVRIKDDAPLGAFSTAYRVNVMNNTNAVVHTLEQNEVAVVCKHIWNDATCTTPKTCSVCKVTDGSALGHKYNAVVTKPTCTEGGYTTYTCPACNDTYVDNRVGATGHSWSDATCTTPKTCSVCKVTEGNALGHKYNAVVTKPTCTEGGYTTYTCPACNDTYVDNRVGATGHSWSDATCTIPKTCSVCKVTEGSALGHKYNAVVTKPTCTEGGYTTYTCSACNDTYVADRTNAAGHSYVYNKNNADMHIVTCSNCNLNETAAHSGNPCTKCGYTSSVYIAVQPVSVTVPNGEKATVTVTAVGEGLTYKWYYKHKNGNVFGLTTSFTGNTYSITMDDTRNGRSVYCVITDKYGNHVQTETVTLNMAGESLKITQQPVSVTVPNGEKATVTVTAVGEGLTYKWYYKHKNGNVFGLTTSFTGNTYSITMDSTRDGRNVYCVITDKYGNKVQSETVTLNMAGESLKITQQPVSVTVPKGESATVKVTAVGDGLTYKWYYKPKNGSAFCLTTAFTGDTYSVAMDSTRDGRSIYCVITDKYGNKVQSETVTLNMAGESLKITQQPVSVTVPNGEKATVTVTAVGEGLTYKWYYKHKNGNVFGLTTSFTGNTYSITMDSTRDGRNVYCVITDKYGNKVQSETVTLNMAGESLKITQQPVSVTVPNGEKATVTVTAVGDGLTYKWYYKHKNGSAFCLTTAFTGDTYSVAMDSTRDGRSIYCVITDKYGNKVKSEIVTINMQ